jgi:hypothetical protein
MNGICLKKNLFIAEKKLEDFFCYLQGDNILTIQEGEGFIFGNTLSLSL